MIEIKDIKRAIQDTRLIENISFIAFLQFFNVIAPLITYPYLIRVLGMDKYGIIITAQVLVGYFSLIINFGTDGVCSKYVSLYRDNLPMLSKIYSSLLYFRTFIWGIGLALYILLILLIPLYRENFLIFLVTYGMTFTELLFSQYFFQGLEKMKFSTLINISTKLLFICLIFIFVKSDDDILMVPVLYSVGYLVGGIFAVFLVLKNVGVKLCKVDRNALKIMIKESLPIFASDMIMTIKDRLNILIMGGCIGTASVVIYDFAMKLVVLILKPSEIIRVALFPRAAKDRSIVLAKKSGLFIFIITASLILLLNIFLKPIAFLFLGDNANMLPIRLLSLAPLIICVGTYISSNVFVAYGYNKFVLNSIIYTTICYIVLLSLFWTIGFTSSIYGFVIISLSSYAVELVYRLVKFSSVCKSYNTK